MTSRRRAKLIPPKCRLTVRTRHDPMFHDLGGYRSLSRTIVLGLALFARLLLLGFRLLLIGLDEAGHWRFLFLQLRDLCLGLLQLLLRLSQEKKKQRSRASFSCPSKLAIVSSAVMSTVYQKRVNLNSLIDSPPQFQVRAAYRLLATRESVSVGRG